MKRKQCILPIGMAIVLLLIGGTIPERLFTGSAALVQQADKGQLQAAENESIRTRLSNVEKRLDTMEKRYVVRIIKDMAPWIAIAISIFALLKDRLLPVKIKGKLISRYAAIGSFGIKSTESKLLFLLRLVILSMNRDFYPRKIEGYIKFEDEDRELQCNIICPRVLVFPIQVGSGKPPIQKKARHVVSENYLSTQVVFPKNKAIDTYVPFYVDRIKEKPIEYTRFEFRDFNNRTKELKLDEKDINPEEQFYDDEIWERGFISKENQKWQN